jgi:GMP synthase (glutamine-hydrolysing)
MVNILVVNNYPERARIDRLAKAFESDKVKVDVVDWDAASPGNFNSHDAVVLSGSPVLFSDGGVESKFSGEIEAVKNASVPILGICFGHQLIGTAFGSKVINTGKQTQGYVGTESLAPDSLFNTLPKQFSVFESHYEVVTSPPVGFTLLAKSPTSPVAAFRKNSIYGIQFHPEVADDQNPDGRIVIRNFVHGLS